MLTKDKDSIYSEITDQLQSGGENAVLPPSGSSSQYCTSNFNSYNIFQSQPLASFGTSEIRVGMEHLPYELKEYIHRQVLHAVTKILENQETWEDFMENYRRKLDEMLLGDDIAG